MHWRTLKTAETVIGALEDAEDYKAFEAAIIADYDAQSAVERELVLRLASILSDEKVGSFQEKISKNDANRITEKVECYCRTGGSSLLFNRFVNG